MRKTTSPPLPAVNKIMPTIDDRIIPVGQHAGRIVAVEPPKAEQENSTTIALPIACCPASPSGRMRSSPNDALRKKALAPNQIIQLLHASSFERLVQIYPK